MLEHESPWPLREWISWFIDASSPTHQPSSTPPPEPPSLLTTLLGSLGSPGMSGFKPDEFRSKRKRAIIPVFVSCPFSGVGKGKIVDFGTNSYKTPQTAIINQQHTAWSIFKDANKLPNITSDRPKTHKPKTWHLFVPPGTASFLLTQWLGRSRWQIDLDGRHEVDMIQD